MLKELCHEDFADFFILALLKSVVGNFTHENIVFEHLKKI